MKFKHLQKGLVYVRALPYQEYTNRNGGVIAITKQTSSLMYGVVLRQPDTEDELFNDSLPPGTSILFSALNVQGDPVVEPIGGQPFFSEGEYVVYARSILAILTKDNDPPSLAKAAPLPDCVEDTN